MIESDEYINCMRHHAQRYFGKPSTENLVVDAPFSDNLGRFEVHCGFDELRQCWLYCTIGAALIETNHQHQEFVILDKDRDIRNVEILSWISHYHFTHGVYVGDILDLGIPWKDDSGLTNILVSLPYPLIPEAASVSCGAAHVADVRWILPIYSLEACYGRNYGVEALEQAFDRAGIDFLSPARAVATG